MTPEKIVENHKKYVLQSWSKQGNLNPIPVAKADGIYFYDFDGAFCHHFLSFDFIVILFRFKISKNGGTKWSHF